MSTMNICIKYTRDVSIILVSNTGIQEIIDNYRGAEMIKTAMEKDR